MIVENYSELFKNKILINSIQKGINTLLKEFENLKVLENEKVSDSNFNLAISSFYQIFDCVPLPGPLLDSFDLPLFRARPNNKKNSVFNKVTDISYNSTNRSAIEAGRFNQPFQGMFYASLPVERSDVQSSLAACLETCKGLTDEKYPVKLKDFTISRWKIIKPFYVICFCFDEKHLSINLSLKKLVDDYLKAIRTCLNRESSDFILQSLTYFSKMSGQRSKHKNEYYILTAMFYAIRYYYKSKENIDICGLIYPSAMTEKRGLNIVLTPQTVDEYLKPDKLTMYRFYLDGRTYHADPCSDAIDIYEDNFVITGFRRIPENKKYTIECEADNRPLLKSNN